MPLEEFILQKYHRIYTIFTHVENKVYRNILTTKLFSVFVKKSIEVNAQAKRVVYQDGLDTKSCKINLNH